MAKPRQPGPGRPATIKAKAFVGIRLPQTLADRLTVWSKSHGVSVSEAVRQLLEQALKKGGKKD